MSHNPIDLMADIFESDRMHGLATYGGSMIGPIDHDRRRPLLRRDRRGTP